MKHAVSIYSALTLLFVALLAVSGSLGGVVSDVIYISSFLLPVAIGLFLHRELKRGREEERGLAEPEWYGLSLGGSEAVDLAIIAPAVIGVIFLFAALTSLVLTALGATDVPIQREHFLIMLLRHAILPAILEELLFRFLPMKLIAPYSRRWCIILSALFFALIHQSFFRMPYALIAGFIFIAIDIVSDSILPSVILHFLNNTLSLVWICYCGELGARRIFLIALSAAALISLLLFILLRRERLQGYLAILKSERTTGGEIGRGPIAVVAVCLLSALLMLLG